MFLMLSSQSGPMGQTCLQRLLNVRDNNVGCVEEDGGLKQVDTDETKKLFS